MLVPTAYCTFVPVIHRPYYQQSLYKEVKDKRSPNRALTAPLVTTIRVPRSQERMCYGSVLATKKAGRHLRNSGPQERTIFEFGVWSELLQTFDRRVQSGLPLREAETHQLVVGFLG